MRFTSASPRPEPPASRARPASRRVNRSKTRSRSSGAMPGPSSSTRQHDLVRRRSRRRPRRARCACRAALSRRLRTTCVSCRLLPSTRPPDTARVSNSIAPGAAADVGEHELVDVDGGVRRVRAALVESGELEEVVDERAEALVLGEQAGRERRASRRAPGRAARPRGRCASSRPGCAARATRPTRTRAGGPMRPRAGRASRSSSRRAGGPRRARPAPAPGGASSCRVIAAPRCGSPRPGAARARRSPTRARRRRSVRNAVSSHRPLPSSSADRCALSSGLATATVSGPSGRRRRAG